METSDHGRLIVAWPDGGQLIHPLPLAGGQTPCDYLRMLGQVMPAERLAQASWWIAP